MADLALGILPLIGTAYSIVRAARKKFNSFRKYSDKVQRIYTGLLVAKASFRNEIELLLRLALGDENKADIDVILESRDVDPDLEAKFQSSLGDDSYSACCALFQQIVADIDCLQQQLESFEPPYEGIDPDRADRLRAGLSYALKESKCKELIANVYASNTDLARLRQQKLELKSGKRPCSERYQSQPDVEVKPRQTSSEYASFIAVRTASINLHHAFSSTYVSGRTRIPHRLKLFADAFGTNEKVMSTLMILCRCEDPMLGSKLMCLQVRSSIEWLRSELGVTDGVQRSNPKRRKVHSQERYQCSSSQLITPPPSEKSSPSDHGPVDLVKSKDPCADLQRGYRLGAEGNPPLGRGQDAVGCIAFMTTLEGFRHSFFTADDSSPVHHQDLEVAAKGITPLDFVLNYDLETAVTRLDQLRLAHSIASTFLKFYHTSWMPDLWALRDLCIIRKSGVNWKRSLSTMHLDVNIQPATATCHSGQGGNVVAMDGVQAAASSPPSSAKDDVCKSTDVGETGTPADEELTKAMLVHGIKNLPLFCLGVVLLQIGRWKPISEGDVLKVRQLAHQPGDLGMGPRYNDLVLKCLQCDFDEERQTLRFGAGRRRRRRFESLEDDILRKSVYNQVVCDLSRMVKALDLGPDVDD